MNRHTPESRLKHITKQRGSIQRPFFADRIYLSEDVDITRLCLAIIAPVSPGHPDFEQVALELERTPNRRMRKQTTLLLKSWVLEFLAGKRPETRLRGPYWKSAFKSALPDDHFLESMFRSFAHQSTIAGRRVGRLDCADLSINRLAPFRSGPAPFSRTWAHADGERRREIKFINRLLIEEEALPPAPRF